MPYFTQIHHTSNFLGSLSLKKSIIVKKTARADESTMVIGSPLVNEHFIKVDSSNEDISDKNSTENSQNEFPLDD